MNIQTTHNTKQTTKLSILLLAALATCGLLAAACGAGQASTDTTIRSAVAVNPPTTTTAEPAPEPTTIGNDELDSDNPCYTTEPADPAAAEQRAKALQGEVKTLFAKLGEEPSKNLAFAYVLCDVTAADVKTVLAEGELGSQYRRLVEALTAGSYQAFTEAYRGQPCLLGSHDFDVNIKSATNLKKLISAVSGAALIHFRPDAQELETIAQNLASDMMDSFQNALETGGEADDHLDETQPATCEQFAKLVAEQSATS